ncbi:hypothetical protein ACG9VV_000868 [Vibrio alginolyticus]
MRQNNSPLERAGVYAPSLKKVKTLLNSLSVSLKNSKPKDIKLVDKELLDLINDLKYNKADGIQEVEKMRKDIFARHRNPEKEFTEAVAILEASGIQIRGKQSYASGPCS